MKTLLLLSGGMDSTALAFWLRPDAAVTINYGQVASAAEMEASQAVCSALHIPHYMIDANVAELGSGNMAGTPALDVAPIPEWWPFRNQFLISVAAMKALNLGLRTVCIGSVRTDGAHADGRSEFFQAMNSVLQLQEGQLTLNAPAIELSSAELIRRSQVTPEVLGWAHSCHVANFACGLCRGCQKHYETLAELGVSPY